MIEAVVGSITAPYLVGKKYYKTAKKWATSAYAEYRFSENGVGSTIIKCVMASFCLAFGWIYVS